MMARLEKKKGKEEDYIYGDDGKIRDNERTPKVLELSQLNTMRVSLVDDEYISYKKWLLATRYDL